ncbi:unnamed protein product [Adineta ricciae]|uniref:Uncharacterized protein n=1 Tax=Adineta ricciae TaxID=249248 RepID=A0A813T848_ADIRI|nr:unnamed protein product [Adineta ricciae]CAF1473987.1 unnamed protein product [Adineta ricciae]
MTFYHLPHQPQTTTTCVLQSSHPHLFHKNFHMKTLKSYFVGYPHKRSDNMFHELHPNLYNSLRTQSHSISHQTRTFTTTVQFTSLHHRHTTQHTPPFHSTSHQTGTFTSTLQFTSLHQPDTTQHTPPSHSTSHQTRTFTSTLQFTSLHHPDTT